jgi:hypothetical protein
MGLLILAPATVMSFIFAAIQPPAPEEHRVAQRPPWVVSRCVGFDRVLDGGLGAADLEASRIAAQKHGTYIQPHSSDELRLALTDGLTFVDTVNGQPVGVPFDPARDASRLARIRVSRVTSGASLVVMGSIALEPGLACASGPAGG